MADKQLLIDHYTFKATLLEDKSTKGGKVIARGEFARADVATENKRMYPKQLWEREIGRLEKQMENRKVYGELDHPGDGRTQLKRSSHLLTNLHLEGSIIVGEAEIMDTTEGKNLKAILAAGGAVGVSSRGFGTTRPNTEGVDVVQDDYRLMTFDFVAEPANTSSYPSIHTEGTNSTQDSQKKTEEVVVAEDKKKKDLTLDELKASNPKLYESFMHDAQREYEKRGAEIWAKKIMAAKDEASTDLRAGFAEQMIQAVNDMKATVREQVRAELMADPGVAGAKAALENVKSVLRPYVIPADVEGVVKEKESALEDLQRKVAEQELSLAKLAQENKDLAGIAKEAGYSFALEKLLSGVDQAALIRRVVGDVRQYESIDALNAKVVEIVDEIKKSSAKHEERDREMDRLVAKNRELEEANQKALEAAKLLSVQLYAEERLKNHPKADQIRSLVESTSPSSKDGVDQLLSKFREPRHDPGALEEARARVRAMVGSNTREYLQEHQERKPAAAAASDEYNGIGMSIDNLRALAGIGNE